MKKEAKIFLLKIFISSFLLGYVWFAYAQNLYPHFLSPVAVPFFKLVGVTKWRLSLLLDHFTNLIPYIALVISTPDLIRNWKKSTMAFFGGLLILMICHLLLSWLDFYFWSQYQMSKSFFKSIFHFYLINDILPLALWLLFYPTILPQLFDFLKFGKKEEK
ncbi:MAG: hypothetical protein ABIJ45_07510 [Candidatus Zixiibacteriota bacterium]